MAKITNRYIRLAQSACRHIEQASRAVSAQQPASANPRATGAHPGILIAKEVHDTMSAAAIEPEPVPLVRDQAGRLMVPGTRISLDILVAAFNGGIA